MASRTLYFTDPAVQPLAKVVCDVLAKRYKLATKPAPLPSVLDGKALRAAGVLKLHPGAVYSPTGKKVAVTYDLVVPGGILPGTVKAEELKSFRVHVLHGGAAISMSTFEFLAYDIATTLAPFLEAPAKRTLALYTRKADKVQLAALTKFLRSHGLEPLAPREAVVDGESMFAKEEKTWRKAAWARLELDFIRSNEAKVCVRGETKAGVEIGHLNHLYKKAFKVKNPSGELPEATRKRLHDLLDRELLPKLGVVPTKYRRDDASILAFLGGGSAPAPAKTKPAANVAPKAAKAVAKAKPAAGARRFEFQGGGSRKFWTVSTKGSTVSVTFGRIGTPGQTKDKSYVSDAAAVAAMQKLVAEKTGKGYVEA